MKRWMSKNKASKWLHLASILTAISILPYCAQQPVDPINNGGGGSSSSGSSGGSSSSSSSGAPGENLFVPPPDDNNIFVDNSARAQCLAECKAACDTEFNDPSEASQKAECKTDCETLPWDEGGCNDVIDNGPQGDPILIPVGSKKIKFSVDVYLHGREDHMIFQGGSISMSSQKGLAYGDVKKDGVFGFVSSLLGSGSLSNWVSGNIPFFGTSGNGYSKAFGASGLQQRAIIKVPLDENDNFTGSEPITWPYPGTLSYNLLKHFPEDRDPEKPVQFVVNRVVEDGDSIQRSMKSSSKQIHFKDYYGPGASVDILKLRKVNRLGFAGFKVPTNGKFTVYFTGNYLPKP